MVDLAFHAFRTTAGCFQDVRSLNGHHASRPSSWTYSTPSVTEEGLKAVLFIPNAQSLYHPSSWRRLNLVHSRHTRYKRQETSSVVMRHADTTAPDLAGEGATHCRQVRGLTFKRLTGSQEDRTPGLPVMLLSTVSPCCPKAVPQGLAPALSAFLPPLACLPRYQAIPASLDLVSVAQLRRPPLHSMLMTMMFGVHRQAALPLRPPMVALDFPLGLHLALATTGPSPSLCQGACSS